jgi:hypothetical protein
MSNHNAPALTGGELAAMLAKKDLRQKAIDKLEKCLEATYTLKSESGELVMYDDFKTIVTAIQTILHYTDGKPVERREVITRKATTLEELRQQAKNSPELRRSLKELLAGSETIDIKKS